MKIIKIVLIVLIFNSVTSFAAIINVSSSPTGCTLFFAILSANADNAQGNCSTGSGSDLIIVPAGGTITLNDALPNITSPMTIRTPNNTTGKYTIDAGGVYIRIYDQISNANNFSILNVINTNSVIFQNLILKNSILDSDTSTGGAGIKINNSEVTLNNVDILNNFINKGTRLGGGVRILNNSVVNFEQCSFADNRIHNNVFSTAALRGGNMAISDSTVSINNTEVKGYFYDPIIPTNGGTAEKGAGIYLDNTDLMISKSLFLSNRLVSSQSETKGSDLYVINNSSVSVINTTFFQTSNIRDNRARVYLKDSTLNLNNVTLWGDPIGGGLELHNSTISSSNSLFVLFEISNSPVAFCKAYNSLGNAINFTWLDDVNNLTSEADDSCNITPLPPAQINFLPSSVSRSNYIEFPANNGGPTNTSRLAPEYNTAGDSINLAINNGNNATCETTDQRGVARVDCDIGAYELNDTADLAIDMSIITPAPYYKGQRIEHSVDISNIGPSEAYGTDVYIDVSGLNIDSWQTNHSCTLQNSNNLNCTISSIVNGGNTVIRLFGIKDVSTSFDGDAFVQYFADFSTDPISANNIDNTNNGGTVVAAADLKVTQTLLTSPPYSINQTVNYQIVVDNLGPNTANDIVLTHTLLQGLTNTSYTGCDSSSATTCNIVLLGNTQSKTITFTATIDASLIKNNLTVGANEFDPKTSNNTAQNKNSVNSNVNLIVEGSLSTSAPYFNEDIIYFNYDIGNGGPDIATNTVIDFTTSNNLILSGASGVCSSLPCTIPSIGVGQAQKVSLSFQAIILSSGQFSAYMTAFSDQTDSDLSNNGLIFVKIANPAVDLDVSLNLLSTPPFYEGQPITFEAKINNAIANTSAVSALLENQLLDNLTIIQVTSTNCVTIPCTLANLDYGLNNQEVITIDATILGAGDFTYTLKATATETETIYINNTATASDTALAIPQEFIFSDGFE